MLVGAYRADEVARDPGMRRRVAELSRVTGVERVALAGLERNAVAVHAAAVLGIPPPPSLVDELVRRGEGNPFFTEELVAAHLAGEAIPTLLSELLEADIASLDPAGRHVLAALATVGRETDPELLAAVVELDEPTTEAAVRAAIDARLLVVDRATDAYQFRHPLIGEVAYNTTLPTERRRLHRAVATALQADPGLALTATDGAGELAFHLDRAGDEAAAFETLFAAADSAELIAPATCLAHLERIFELWERHATPEHQPQLVPRLWQAADLASATGDNERAVALARRALDLGDPPEGRAWAYERLGRFLWSSGLMEESAETYAHAAALLDAAPEQDAAGAAFTYGGLAQAELMFCRFDRAEHWAKTGDGDRRLPRRDVTISWLARARCRGDARRRGPSWARALPGGGRRQARTPPLGTRQRHAGDDPLRRRSHRGGTAHRPRRRRRVTARRLRDELRDLPRRCRRPLLGAPGPLGGGRPRPRRRRIAASRPRSVPSNSTPQPHRWPLVADGSRPLPNSLNAFVAIPLIRSARAIIDAALVDVHLAAKQWDRAVDIASSALSAKPSTAPRFVARFTAGLVTGTVEGTLDQLARQEAVDVDAILLDLRRRMDVARADPSSVSPAAAADIAIAEAMITRLGDGDPAAFAQAAVAAERIGDAWLTAVARLHEADAAASARRGRPGGRCPARRL